MALTFTRSLTSTSTTNTKTGLVAQPQALVPTTISFPTTDKVYTASSPVYESYNQEAQAAEANATKSTISNNAGFNQNNNVFNRVSGDTKASPALSNTKPVKSSNLPPGEYKDSAEATKLFFDTYGETPLEFSANDVEQAIGFFQKKGFDKDAAQITGAILLKQSKLENIVVSVLLDRLKNLDNNQLTALVIEILNNNRPASSSLGFRGERVEKKTQSRNISA